MSDESTILLEEHSPSTPLTAVVESDGRTVYLYLHGQEEDDLQACWVRNLVPAPANQDEEAMREGRAPLLAFMACAHPAGLPAPTPDELSVVWFESGDAVALFAGDELLAMIPPWSTVQDCPGHAAGCRDKTPLAWPLGGKTDDNPIRARVEQARAFWTRWESGEPWIELQRLHLEAIESALDAPHTGYFAIDGGKWPPKFLVRVDRPDAMVLATGGVSVRPMPQVERWVQDARSSRRIELAFAIDPALNADPIKLAQHLATLASFPWNHTTWLADRHSVQGAPVPVGPSGTRFQGALLAVAPKGAPALNPPDCDGDTVQTLWVIPITAAERQLAVDQGSDTLIARLDAAGVNWVHRDRSCVAAAPTVH